MEAAGEPAAAEQGGRAPAILFAIAFLGLTFFLLLASGMRRGIDHDEHQFVAAGALLARRGLLPYRDYPYFHMPNLVLVYGLCTLVTDHLLLAARLVSTLAAFGAACILFAASWRLTAARPPIVRALLAAGSVLLLVADPLFAFTSGRAWNHDVPVLLTLLAFLAFRRGLAERRATWIAAAGALLGGAIGTRLTFAPAAAAFLAAVVAREESGRMRLRGALALAAGALCGLLPSIVLLAVAPRQFNFGNVTYAFVNTAYRAAEGHPGTTLVGKIGHFIVNVLLEPNVAVVVLGAVASLWWVRARRGAEPHPRSWDVRWLGALSGCLFAGALLPSPPFPQYYYAPLPFLILLLVEATHERRPELFAALAVLSCLIGIYTEPRHFDLRSSLDWYTIAVHRAGGELAARAGPGKILTLAPIFPLEGGLDVYEALATGPFAFRVAPLLDAEQRATVKAIGAAELPALLEASPPAAVLLGPEEGEVERALRDYAVDRGFRTAALSKDPVWERWPPSLMLAPR